VLPPGQVVDGRFLIREIAGRSGMATIYRAEDLLQQNREVAVKIPLMKVESDPAGFARFRNEERIGLQMDHPLLLKFYPVEESKTRPYLVTEFLRGCTLDRFEIEARPLAEAEAFRIGSLICEGLKHLHGRGFVHRDLKPGNIMICCDETLRIMDFGLSAKIMRRRSLWDRLLPVFGTPQYMAPEQVEQSVIDERTDIYCLGAVLYQLLTGSTPLEEEDAWQSAYRRLTGDPVAPRGLNPAITPQGEEILLRALQRRPRDRYQTVAALKADLDAPEQVTVTGLCDRLQPPRWKLGFSTTPLLVGALLSVGLILFLVLAFFIIRLGLK
jgi:serine/threonine protein kinase